MTREARFRTVRFRASATALVLLLLSTSSIRGYCPMSVPVAASGQMASSHDCCKTGLTDQIPSCCHADIAPITVTTLKSTWAAATLPVGPLRIMPAVAESPSAIAALPSVSSHSPPPTVLRI